MESPSVKLKMNTPTPLPRLQEGEEDAQNDYLVARMMASAKVSQEKRDSVWKQA
jgi:hypothetical protein